MVQTDTGQRLPSAPSDVSQETEDFIFQWMRSKARLWGDPVQRKRGEIPQLRNLEVWKKEACEANPCLPEVGRKIEAILQRALQDNAEGSMARDVIDGWLGEGLGGSGKGGIQ